MHYLVEREEVYFSSKEVEILIKKVLKISQKYFFDNVANNSVWLSMIVP